MVTTPQPDDNVEEILTRMMAQNSGLMKGARTQGLQSAQQAGLGQSTMGIQAAQAAAYNAAVPLASQQAQQAHQKGLQAGQFGHETGMQQAQFGQQTALQGQQFGHETGMQTRGFQHAATQSELDRAQQMQVLNQSASLDRLKMHEGLAIEQNFQAAQNQAQRSMQERLASMELAGADRERALASLSQINSAWNSGIAQIASNPDLPAQYRQQYMADLSTIRDFQYSLVNRISSAGGVSW